VGDNRIRKVVIAGGGTAGWIAASALAYQLQGQIELTLVESSKIATVGVGEATVPPVRNFHRFMNIDEQEFLRAVAGTFKLAISFENFVRPGHRYIHPFGNTGKGTLVAGFQQYWLESLRRGMKSDLGNFSLEAMAALEDKFALT
jgi:tryptophan halogenase